MRSYKLSVEHLKYVELAFLRTGQCSNLQFCAERFQSVWASCSGLKPAEKGREAAPRVLAGA